MGNRIAAIVYNQDYENLNQQGLSEIQVELIKEIFFAILEECNVQDEKMSLGILSNFLKIPKKSAKILMDFVDIDCDGKIDDYEFICMVGLFMKTEVEEKLTAVFELFDEDYSQLIQGEELQNLIGAILAINSNSVKVEKIQIDAKIDKIEDFLFSDEREMKLSEFMTLVKEDEDFQNSLRMIGVMSEADLASNMEDDLEQEFNKGINTIDNEVFQQRRMGLEQQGLFEEQKENSDQFMAIKPYLGTIMNSVPSDFDGVKNLQEPNINLNLQFVHGFRSFDTRNNIFYVDKDNFVTHSAAVSFKHTISKRNQIFNFGNNDDITCMDKVGNLIATGQMGAKPILNLIDITTMETIALIAGKIKKGIAHVAISHNQQYLVATSMNDTHDVFIYEISQNSEPKFLKKVKGPRDVILDVKFSLDNDKILMATKRELYTLIFGQDSRIKKCIGWGKSKQLNLVIGFVKKCDAVIGLRDGRLAILKGNQIVKFLQAHSRIVYAMTWNKQKNKLFTGGADGKIIIWNENMKQEEIINLDSCQSFNPKIRSLSYCEEQDTLLIGTRGSEIYEYSLINKSFKRILSGHFQRELWGLAIHQEKQEFVTVGEDFKIAKWSIKEKKMLMSQKMKFQADCVTLNNLNICVGCKNGRVLLYEYSNLKLLKIVKISKKPISVIKYSLSGDFVAIGCRNSKIYICNSQLQKKAICKGHHSTITHLDFSQDESFLQSNCTSYELLYWRVQDGKQLTKGASSLRDEKWQTWSCVLGWPVQGIFPPCSDGTDVNSVDRYNNFVVTGDDFGNVKIFKFPNFKNSSYNKFVGHSSHVTNVKFSHQGQYVISLGGNDKSIFQWEVRGEEVNVEEYEEGSDEEFINIEDEGEENTGIFALQEEEADEFMAVKPWIGDLNNSIPSDYKYLKGMEEPPNENLKLQYVHGYRCFDTRNSAKFSHNSNIIFIQAALGVEMNIEENTQTFFNEHDEDLVSFALHPNRQIAATGQMAAKGRSKMVDLFVWNIETKEILSHIKGFHLRAVQLLQFTPNGKYLLSFGKDDDNSLAIYEWESGMLLGTQKVDKKNVLDVAIKSNNQEFMTVGSRHVKIWKFSGGRISGCRVGWGRSRKAVSVLCCESIKSGYVIGTIKGEVIKVNGSIGKGLTAHKGKVYVIKNHQNYVFTGGQDGCIVQLDISSKINKIKVIANINSIRKRIRSLDIKDEDMLIGNGAAELFLLKNYQNNDQPVKVLEGHFLGELWGLTVDKNQQIFYSVGEDKTVRKWSLSDNNQLAMKSIDQGARAIDVSYSSQLIIVGTLTGKLILLDHSLNILQDYQSSNRKKNQWIQDIKFSPNDNFVAYGIHGGVSKVEIVKIQKNIIKKYAVINAGITSALLHLDWSTDSSNLVINSQAYELKFVDILSKRSIRASSCRDMEWQTWTCKIGFPVQGIYPGVDGTDVNTVSRASSQTFMATGDDFQLVKLFKYPSTIPKSNFKSYKGHSSHVTRVQFSQGDQYLISAGGNDKALIVWAVESEEIEDDFDFVERKVKKDQNQEINQIVEKQGLFEIQQEEDNEFMAVKPWLGAIRPPSDFTEQQFDQDAKPEINVELDYVYGYRAKDCRNNLILHDNKLYYYAAALTIRLDYVQNQQSFMDSHSDDVIALDFDKNQEIFASGEIGPKPKIKIWSQEMELIKTLKGGIIKGVCAISFSPSGEKLSAICIDDNHMVAVFDVLSGKLLAVEKGDTAKIVDVAWYSESQFMTVGINHVKNWTIKTSQLTSKRGSFYKSIKKLIFAKFFNQGILVGSTCGHLQLFKSGSCLKSVKLSNRAIDAVEIHQDIILAGGKQKEIYILNKSLKILNKVNLQSFLFKGQVNMIRSLQYKEDQGLFIGLYSSQIFRIEFQGKIEDFNTENLKIQEIMSGHYSKSSRWTNEVWGLFPLSENRFLSCSDDATLRLWDANLKKSIKILDLNLDKKGAKLEPKRNKDVQDKAKLRSVGVDEVLMHAAVGCKEGTIRIVDIKKWEQIKVIKKRKRWIQDLKYSPDHSKLAVGSHDAKIDIYCTQRNYQILYKLKKHSAFITHLDWSVDSNFLHSNCGAYELLFWNVNDGSQLTSGASALKDEDWATWSCVLGWPVQGIFRQNWDGSDINMVDRSKREISGNQRVIACADDFGKIRIYKYPCLDKSAEAVILKGHSSHVTNVKFNDEDSYIFSTGGEDQTVMQWRILI